MSDTKTTLGQFKQNLFGYLSGGIYGPPQLCEMDMGNNTAPASMEKGPQPYVQFGLAADFSFKAVPLTISPSLGFSPFHYQSYLLKCTDAAGESCPSTQTAANQTDENLNYQTLFFSLMPELAFLTPLPFLSPDTYIGLVAGFDLSSATFARIGKGNIGEDAEGNIVGIAPDSELAPGVKKVNLSSPSVARVGVRLVHGPYSFSGGVVIPLGSNDPLKEPRVGGFLELTRTFGRKLTGSAMSTSFLEKKALYDLLVGMKSWAATEFGAADTAAIDLSVTPLDDKGKEKEYLDALLNDTLPDFNDINFTTVNSLLRKLIAYRNTLDLRRLSDTVSGNTFEEIAANLPEDSGEKNQAKETLKDLLIKNSDKGKAGSPQDNYIDPNVKAYSPLKLWMMHEALEVFRKQPEAAQTPDQCDQAVKLAMEARKNLELQHEMDDLDNQLRAAKLQSKIATNKPFMPWLQEKADKDSALRTSFELVSPFLEANGQALNRGRIMGAESPQEIVHLIQNVLALFIGRADPKCETVAAPVEKKVVTITVTETKEGGKLNLPQPIFFAVGSAVISKKSYEVLDSAADFINKSPSFGPIHIQAHTDSSGSDKLNLTLSQQRAASVKAYLMAKEVPEERLIAEGFGESRPIATNKTRDGKAQNRRVEFIIKASEAPQGKTENGLNPNNLLPRNPKPLPNGDSTSDGNTLLPLDETTAQAVKANIGNLLSSERLQLKGDALSGNFKVAATLEGQKITTAKATKEGVRGVDLSGISLATRLQGLTLSQVVSEKHSLEFRLSIDDDGNVTMK